MVATISKDDVDFRESPSQSVRCGTCTHFNDGGTCDLVMGIIAANDVCDLWKDRRGDRADIAPSEESIVAAGIAVVALDTGRVLLIQRSIRDLTDPARGRWEFPGGTLEEGERPIDAAAREWKEETGLLLPQDGYFIDGWHSANGVYAGYVFLVRSESDLSINPDWEDRLVRNPDDPRGKDLETQAWFEIVGLEAMPQLREEVRDAPWEKLLAAVTPTPPHADPDNEFANKESTTMATTTPIKLEIDIDSAVKDAISRAFVSAEAVTLVTLAAPLPDTVELTDEDFNWHALLLVEGAPTGDGRFIKQGGIIGHRDLPLSLMVMFSNPDGGVGHAGATIAGRIDSIEKVGDEWWGTGIYDRESPAGRNAARLNKLQMLRGISVDLDGPPTVVVDSMGRMSLSNARIMGATQCPFAAYAEAHINLVKVEHDPTIVCPCKALKAEANELQQGEFIGEDGQVTSMATLEVLPDDTGAIEPGHCGCGGDCCGESGMALVASGAPQPDVLVWTPYGPGIPALVASGAPVAPPAAWFELPSNPAIHPVRMTSEGQILGYAATWGECHLSNLADCVPVPAAGPQGYHRFHTGQVRTAEGTIVQTGPVFMGGDHPDKWLNQQETMAAYGATSAGVGDIRVYEDSVGIYCCGAARPGVTEAQVRTFNGSDGASPDWRPIRGQYELVAMLMVNMSAFHVGNPTMALVASGAPGRMVAELNPVTGEMSAIQGAPPIQVADPIEARMAALESKIAFVDGLKLALERQLAQQQVDEAFAALPDPVADANEAALALLDAIRPQETVEA